MANLLIGIGGFGLEILHHVHKKNMLASLSKITETLLIIDDEKSADYPFPTAVTIRGLGIIKTYMGFETKEDLLQYIANAESVVIFAGVGGSFTCEALYEIIHSPIIDNAKIYIAAVSPFAFEGRAKAAIAKETLKMILDAQIGCGIYANDDLIDKNQNDKVIARMEAFNEIIIASIPW